MESSTRKTETGPPLPFPPSRFLHRTVLYYTVLYCTVLYYVLCTVLSSPGSYSISKKFTCLDSLTGGPRMHPDMLFSLLSRLLSLIHGESSRKVVFDIESTDPVSLRLACGNPILVIDPRKVSISFNHELGVHTSVHICPYINPHKKPSLVPFPFPPSSLCHIFYISKIQDGCKKKKNIYIYNSKNQKTATRGKKKHFRKQTLPKVDVLVPKHY